MMTNVFDERRRRIVLAEQIARGGEATIHRVKHRPRVLAKVYHETHRTRERGIKLATLRRQAPKTKEAIPLVAWPRMLLKDERGRVIGFLMPRAPANALILHLLTVPKTRPSGVTYQHLLRIARNLSIAIAQAHHDRCVIGDINESNALVHPSLLVTLIDVDSWEFTDKKTRRRFLCPVSKPLFTAPEARHNKCPSTRHRDTFALAILLYQLLCFGRHPHTTSGVMIEEGIGLGRTNLRERTKDVVLELTRPSIPPPLYGLFDRCFGPGHRHPEHRPAAKEWARALEATEGQLRACPRISTHIYAAHLHACPWCKIRNETGWGPFSSP